ncbi:lipase family protein [Nocardia sp. XZ_19_385]|uniref:lipase family protein n=1 Tax=Nocardia sp. XZ_19_385 TaxID=2769488 RepID=UPI00188FE0E6|nr:lipase family protein [Nocardia sp. XZ_19_385]
MTQRLRSGLSVRVPKTVGANIFRGARIFVVGCAVALSVVAPARAEELLPPNEDLFYSFDGSLDGVEPGTVLRDRPVQLAAATPALPVPVEGIQLLYRTTGQTGGPLLGVATVIRPLNPVGELKIVSFQNFYDALGSQCNPSYSLRGGGRLSEYGRYVDLGVIARYLASGYTVVVPDYEGVNLAFGAGRQAGQVTLDSIRAAEHRLGADPGQTPVVMLGYSGGSIATEFAAEGAANGYAPELNIVGVAEGGLPVDYQHAIDYMNGTQAWSRVIPLILAGVARGYGIDLDPYLSDYGKQVMDDVQTRCLETVDYTLSIQDLLRPEYQDYMTVPELAHMLSDTRMRAGENPKAPMFVMIGNSDGYGDGVMVTGDERELMRGYCAKGVPVQFRETTIDHKMTGLAFMAAVATFVDERFNQAPAVNDCAAI